jgi:hypothetical protein
MTEMVFPTRTDKLGKELLTVSHDLAEYQSVTGSPFHRVLPQADTNTSRDHGSNMDVSQNYTNA